MPEGHRDHAGIFIPPPLFYVVPFVLGLLLQRVAPMPLGVAGARPVLRTVGGVLAGAGVLLGVWAVVAFRRAGTSVVPIKPTTTIVAAGPYRYSRNPMYVGLALVYLGLTLITNAVWPIVLFPAAVVAIQVLVIGREERYLEERFGDAYRWYRERVRRWI
jgi:protein-S-isoprenylcysteine O-methyltransferase Ste14